MTLIGVITRLGSLGYSIALVGGNIRLSYRGDGSPPKERALPLVEILRTHKEEILSDPHFLIDLAVQEINEGWEPGTLEWMKRNRPREWGKMLAVEGEINDSSLQKDSKVVKGVLAEYKSLMLSMVKEFSSIRGDEACVHKDERLPKLGMEFVTK